jgi:hypothetical protein
MKIFYFRVYIYFTLYTNFIFCHLISYTLNVIQFPSSRRIQFILQQYIHIMILQFKHTRNAKSILSFSKALNMWVKNCIFCILPYIIIQGIELTTFFH